MRHFLYLLVWRDKQLQWDEDRACVLCIAVNVAAELSYASKAAPAIWPPPPHPSLLFSPHPLLTLSVSLLHTLTQHSEGTRLCVCPTVHLSIRVCLCVGGVLASSGSGAK